MRWQALTFAIALLTVGGWPAAGIILLGGDNPAGNAVTPGDNSGWQFEGEFNGFLATPIAPQYFLAAAHIGGGVGNTILYHGQTFTTVAVYDDLTAETLPTAKTDLRIWKIDGTFPTWAPLYTSGQETGKELRVFGRGAQRGEPLTLDGSLKGWGWSNANYLQRWGANTVAAVVNEGQYVLATFDRASGDNEAHLSAGDSSGGLFVQEDGLWKLAAINYGVEDVYRADGSSFSAALFDKGGYYTKDENDALVLVPDGVADVPTYFASTRVVPRLGWIQSIVGGDLSALPPEPYPNWLQLYYRPDEINDATKAGPGADPDGDGVSNLLEFASNLDPTFAEPVVLAPGSGVRGLPSIRMEGSANERRLTVEFVRRTTASGAGLTYAAQFASSLASGDWQTNGDETVTAINARWERVKVTDSLGGKPGARFARVQVTAASAARDQGAAGERTK